MDVILQQLLDSPEAALRYKARRFVLGEDPQSPAMLALQAEIAKSPAARALLSERAADGRIERPPYQKWRGAHWVLAQLADLYYPPGDRELIPLREQVAAWLPSLTPHVVLAGRERFCASIPANALFAMLRLGIATPFAEELAHLLMDGQWPDGGWNCDKRLAAHTSSLHESLIPLRALALYARHSGDPRARTCAERAAELFLARRLFHRLSDGSVIDPQFIQLHYPYYWRYNFLLALVVMMEGGWLDDPRCAEALDFLALKRLPDGGFAAETAYYRVRGSDDPLSGCTPVPWGGVRNNRSNPWVSADALSVLRAAGRYP